MYRRPLIFWSPRNILVIIGYYFGNIFSFIPREFQIGFGIAAVVGAYFALRQISRSLARSNW